MHCNSPIYSSSNNCINTKNIETYADSISLIPWLPWLVLHLWRLGRLGSQGWLVGGAQGPGRMWQAARPHDVPGMPLALSAGALSLQVQAK